MSEHGDPSTALTDGAAEARLVEAVRRGDVAAFDGLVRRYLRRAYTVAYRLLEHREDAEDLVQEAFMTALEKIDTFQPGRPLGPWFFRILINRGQNLRAARARRATQPIPPDAAAETTSPAHAAERAELRAWLDDALAQLPERQRLIVQFFEVDGFSGAEIAAMLEIAPATVRWNLHQARKKLRTALVPLVEEEVSG
jgi:RNA polymerase sigma-70 factor (ECF subfamily)